MRHARSMISALAALGIGSAAMAQPMPKTFETLVHFSEPANGKAPFGVTFLQGQIYGTTVGGGTKNAGVLYQFNPATSAETVLTKFSIKNTNGYNPGVIDAAGSTLYIMTSLGGEGQYTGTIYLYDTKTGRPRQDISISLRSIQPVPQVARYWSMETCSARAPAANTAPACCSW